MYSPPRKELTREEALQKRIRDMRAAKAAKAVRIAKVAEETSYAQAMLFLESNGVGKESAIAKDTQKAAKGEAVEVEKVKGEKFGDGKAGGKLAVAEKRVEASSLGDDWEVLAPEDEEWVFVK